MTRSPLRPCPAPPTALPAALCLILLVAGCSGAHAGGGAQAAIDTLQAFQRALQQRDQTACRELLTSESRPLLLEMPWAEVAKRKPLRVVDASLRREHGHEYLVDVVDPNEGGSRSQFVVVREYGRLVVDLIATAGLHTVVTANEDEPTFEPRPLTPADHDRIREFELAQPPRETRGN